MATQSGTTAPAEEVSDGQARLVRRYACGPLPFAGADDAFYERHLAFDNVLDLASAGPRERFEAFARSVRDVVSQRWMQTARTYAHANPKRVYYLSMEFLLGRSLVNNVTNLQLHPAVWRVIDEKHFDWLELLEQEPDEGLGNGGLGRLAEADADRD